jgi:lipoprotein-anchoring transpeptidase ErfK/SrfK
VRIAGLGTIALALAALVVALGFAVDLGAAAKVARTSPRSGSLRQPVTGGAAGSGAGAQPRTARSTPGERLAAVAARRRPLGAQILRATALHASPGGPVVDRLERRTAFDGRQVVAVVARRGAWLGVLHDALPNGRAGWLRARDVRLWSMPYTIGIDLSARRAIVRRDGRVVERFRVGIGEPASPTPVGRFAITDRLSGGPGSPYGCCIFALSGRQPHLPAGWTGGDRLALHGTPDGSDVGTTSTAGCLNARASVLRRLMRRLPVGTPVRIRA